MIKKSFSFDEVPFYWRVASKQQVVKSDIPSRLPFTFIFDETLQLVRQKRTRQLDAALKKVYQADFNIGNIQNENQWGQRYADDFFEFIKKYVTQKSRILEIGSGGGLLLATLQLMGHQVVGIDPAPLAMKEALHQNIEVITDFYPSKKVKGKFNVIFHSDVIEHVKNPLHFLKEQWKQLAPEGLIFISTPDATEAIQKGDVSIILHQHLSFFDKESLQLTLQNAGFKQIKIVRAAYGGSLYAVAKKSSQENKRSVIGFKKFESFIKKSKRTIAKFQNRFYEAHKRGDSIGIYAPVRVLPYLATIQSDASIRFFDDTAFWYGKFIDGTIIKIENFDDLMKNPVKSLFIMSPTFGEIIRKKIETSINVPISITLLTELYS